MPALTLAPQAPARCLQGREMSHTILGRTRRIRMRRTTLVLALLAVSLVLLGARKPKKAKPPKAAVDHAAETVGHGPAFLTGPLPDSLANLYPPVAEQPLLVMAMHGMAQAFEGMFSDMMQGDMEGVNANLAAFKGAYQHASTLVPEWSDAFPAEPVAQFEEALGTGDQQAIMAAAMVGVGTVCHDCHLANMVRVKYRYRFGDFAQIPATDPMTGASTNFTGVMQGMSFGLTGTINDLRQGQAEAAAQNYTAFKAWYEVSKGTCFQGCHDSERHYYISPDVDSLVSALGAAVEAGDVEAASEAAMGIGMKSCDGCHNVHIGAAMEFQKERPWPPPPPPAP
jgi:hypothetical protein